jgi:type IV fimbrial biogenesis protein FimT
MLNFDEKNWVLAHRCKPEQLGSIRHLGLTIVEMMVALAVAAVLMGIGIPAFNDFVAQRTMTTQANDFVLALQYARSEAGRRGVPVHVRARSSEAGNEWGGGWCVMVGVDTCDATSPAEGTEVLRRFPSVDPNEFSSEGALGSLVTFNSRGFVVQEQDGEFLLCNNPDVERDPGRQVSLSRVGRVNVSRVECYP